MISSGYWTPVQKKDEQRAKDAGKAATPIVSQMRSLSLVAIEKSSDGSVVVIADGFADNLWGLLFLSPDLTDRFSPPSGDWTQIQTGVWMFIKGGQSPR